MCEQETQIKTLALFEGVIYNVIVTCIADTN